MEPCEGRNVEMYGEITFPGIDTAILQQHSVSAYPEMGLGARLGLQAPPAE